MKKTTRCIHVKVFYGNHLHDETSPRNPASGSSSSPTPVNWKQSQLLWDKASFQKHYLDLGKFLNEVLVENTTYEKLLGYQICSFCWKKYPKVITYNFYFFNKAICKKRIFLTCKEFRSSGALIQIHVFRLEDPDNKACSYTLTVECRGSKWSTSPDHWPSIHWTGQRSPGNSNTRSAH